MPYPSATGKLVFSGTISGGEVFACGIHYRTDADPFSQAQWDTLTTALRAAVETYFGTASVKAAISTGVTLTTVSNYSYVPNGTVASLVSRQSTAVLAGSGVISLPPQCALVVSLRTQDPSRRGKGRFYLPMLGALSGTGQLANATASGIATASAAMLNTMNSTSGVLSVIGGTSEFPVTSCVVDTIVDTQRRRRNKLAAQGTGIAVVTP